MSPTIRPATPDDAAAIGSLSAQFADYLRSLGDTTNFQFTAEIYLRDGFGPHPAFAGIVAEVGSQVVAYLLYHFGYDVDNALRQLHIIDFYVQASHRQHGIGQAMMHEAARIAQAHGAGELFWAVYIPNTLASRFYEKLGAEYVEELRLMHWRVGEVSSF